MQPKRRSVIVSCVIGLIILLILFGVFIFKNSFVNNNPEWDGNILATLNFADEEFHIGDQMILALDIIIASDYQFEISELVLPEGIELKNIEKIPPKKYGKGLRYITRYHLTTFQPGEYQLPDLLLFYTHSESEREELIITGPTLKVTSLLNDDAHDIRDLKPLARVPIDPLPYCILTGLILLFILGYLIFRRMKFPKNVSPKIQPPLSAHTIAYQRLARLDTSNLIEIGQIDQFFTILSEIVREYIENRFGINAMEMTTQEFLENALHQLWLIQNHQKLLRDFLHQSDLVKYARHIPQYDQIYQALLVAKRFIDETKMIEEEE